MKDATATFHAVVLCYFLLVVCCGCIVGMNVFDSLHEVVQAFYDRGRCIFAEGNDVAEEKLVNFV